MDPPTDSDSSDSEGYSSFDRNLEVTRSPSQHDMLPLLECPVCFDLPLPPIRTCVQGHILCADCCCKLERCPLCQQRIDIGRNFFAEDFLNKSVIKCKFRLDGCPAELVGAYMKAHLQMCPFRPVKCRGCRARVPFSDFEMHMLASHGIGRWDLNDQGIRIVMSQKQRSRVNRGLFNDTGPMSMKLLCASLFVTAVLTIFVDFYYGKNGVDYSVFFV